MPPKGNINNLCPVKTKEEARERGRNGGIKSGRAKREKKLFEQKYAEYFGKKNLTDVFEALMSRKDSATVALLKEAREAVDGNEIDIKGQIVLKIDNDDNEL